MAVRRLYEPLCIAFGTTVSSPTVPTYQLYDLPHKFTPRLYMESEVGSPKTPTAMLAESPVIIMDLAGRFSDAYGD